MNGKKNQIDSESKIQRLIKFDNLLFGLIINDLDRNIFSALKIPIKPLFYDVKDQSLIVELMTTLNPIERGIWPKVFNFIFSHCLFCFNMFCFLEDES